MKTLTLTDWQGATLPQILSLSVADREWSMNKTLRQRVSLVYDREPGLISDEILQLAGLSQLRKGVVG